MDKITTLIPDVEVLLQLAPEELAGTILRLARQRLQNGMVHAQVFAADLQEGHGNP